MMVPLGLRLVLFGNTSRCCPSTSVLLACTRSLRTLLVLALSAEPNFATPLVWGPLVGPHYRWGRHRGRPVLDVMHGGSNRAPRMRCRPPVGRQSIRVHRRWHIPSVLGVMHGGSNGAPRMRCRPLVGRQSIRVHGRRHIPNASRCCLSTVLHRGVVPSRFSQLAALVLLTFRRLSMSAPRPLSSWMDPSGMTRRI